MWLEDTFSSAESDLIANLISVGTQLPVCSLAGPGSPACADLSEAASI